MQYIRRDISPVCIAACACKLNLSANLMSADSYIPEEYNVTGYFNIHERCIMNFARMHQYFPHIENTYCTYDTVFI